MKIRIKRQAYPGAEPYWQSFGYDGPADSSVAAALDYLNYRDDIVDIDGASTTRIGWECSCLQGMCGACAMVINGRPALACQTFLRDLGEEAVIEPLRKFPVVSDLVVDRAVIHENLLATNAYIGEAKAGQLPTGKKAEKEYEHQYAAAKCLKCGLCLEVCPNYVRGENFFGAAFANDCYLIATRREEGMQADRAGKAAKTSADGIGTAYAKHFAAGCSKALSCAEVCPAGVPTLASMAKMNRNAK